MLAAGWKAPERFAAKGRDGATDIYGVIWRPTNFDPKKKYPIIEDIYAGPQDSYVPKGFQSYYRDQSLAELGFIVVQIDGMGTSNRSKKFHDVCFKNLGDAGLPDRISWIRAAAAKYPYMDLSRVGIFGGSAGGQNAARAVMAHGDFYKVAVADCGCHDNRMDKIWWNEQWMSWPVGPEYAESSNVTYASRLSGKLLLIVGEMDTNVDPASTMQVVNALDQSRQGFRPSRYPRLESRRRRIPLRLPPPRRLFCAQSAWRRTAREVADIRRSGITRQEEIDAKVHEIAIRTLASPGRLFSKTFSGASRSGAGVVALFRRPTVLTRLVLSAAG